MPSSSSTSPPLESLPSEGLASNGQQVSVLVVEDDVATRDTLCAAITGQQEMRVAASLGTVALALDWLGLNQPDVLLTDLGLPDGSGIEVIRACAQLYPLCDILVITMFGDEKNVIESLDAGAMGYILKDADDLNVAQFIVDLRQGGSPISPRIARQLLRRVQRPTKANSKAVGLTDPDQIGRDRQGSGATVSSQSVEYVADRLTQREAEVLDLIARGYSYLEIGDLLGVSVSTVQTHIKRVYGKLSVHTRSQAIFEASKLGLLQAGLLSKTVV